MIFPWDRHSKAHGSITCATAETPLSVLPAEETAGRALTPGTIALMPAITAPSTVVRPLGSCIHPWNSGPKYASSTFPQEREEKTGERRMDEGKGRGAVSPLAHSADNTSYRIKKFTPMYLYRNASTQLRHTIASHNCVTQLHFIQIVIVLYFHTW